MENVVFTQLSIPEVRKLLREELEGYFSSTPQPQPVLPEPDTLLTIQQAADLLHLTVPTLYGKVHSREIPFSKQGKRLYFSRAELTAWVQAGRQKTAAETAAAADAYMSNRKKKGGSHV